MKLLSLTCLLLVAAACGSPPEDAIVLPGTEDYSSPIGSTSRTNDGQSTPAVGSDTGRYEDRGAGGTGGEGGPMGQLPIPGGICGNGQVDTGEQCDMANLNGASCGGMGFASGTLGCDLLTCTFDTSMCVAGGTGTAGAGG